MYYSFSYLYSKIIQRLRGKAIVGSEIDTTSKISSGSQIVNVKMDRYSYCGHDCTIINTEIGAFCSIADHVFIGAAEHPIHWASTSPVFEHVSHSGPTRRFQVFDLPEAKRTFVGNDVWIGHAVTIKSGVTIGHGAVIGSNAMVTNDVPPYAIVGGVPARIIRFRFDDATIEALLRSCWWNLDDDSIQQYSAFIQDPMIFAKKAIDAQTKG